MSATVEYGVFRVGQIWRVVSPDGGEYGFTDYERAVSTAHMLAAVHRACGEPAQVVVLDDVGRLVVAPDLQASHPA